MNNRITCASTVYLPIAIPRSISIAIRCAYARIYIYRILILKETGGGDKEQPAGSRYASSMSAEMEIPSCVRGYHVYKDIWAADVGELLMCCREPRQ